MHTLEGCPKLFHLCLQFIEHVGVGKALGANLFVIEIGQRHGVTLIGHGGVVFVGIFRDHHLAGVFEVFNMLVAGLRLIQKVGEGIYSLVKAAGAQFAVVNNALKVFADVQWVVVGIFRNLGTDAFKLFHKALGQIGVLGRLGGVFKVDILFQLAELFKQDLLVADGIVPFGGQFGFEVFNLFIYTLQNLGRDDLFDHAFGGGLEMED